ncbi:MAG: ribonuclease H-like domain-containing protein [Pseudomonadota bacterium]
MIDPSASAHIYVHNGDLPDGLEFGDAIAVDTETMGLRFDRDRLCLVQMTDGDGNVHLVKFGLDEYAAPKLRACLNDNSRLKIFHFGRFDMAVLSRFLNIDCRPVYCTKIASKIARTYTDRHGLRDLVRELLGADMTKTEQSSDWGRNELTEAQKLYAARDVSYLHQLRDRLDAMLRREGRLKYAQECFKFLPARVELDLAGWGDVDIFAHS